MAFDQFQVFADFEYFISDELSHNVYVLEFAARFLVVGGRLIYWLPIASIEWVFLADKYTHVYVLGFEKRAHFAQNYNFRYGLK